MDELVAELLQLSDATFKEKAKSLGVKIGIVSKTTKKLYAKKIARSILENAGKPEDPPASVGCIPDDVPGQQKASFEPDGKFYAIRVGTESKIFTNKLECDQYLKENKKLSPRFAIFEDGDNARLWVNRSINTPKKIRLPFQCQGPNESPLRRPKKDVEANFTGELKLPYSEPSQPLLNRLTNEIRQKPTSAYNMVVEEIMKNPRLLLTKAEYPVIFQPGTWSNIIHLCCQYNSDQILSAVLNFIGDVTIMRKLFPEIKDEAVLGQKLNRIRENYLNLPRVGPKQSSHIRGDTPLHIAARFHSNDIIYSMSKLPEWERLRKAVNSEGLTPIEILDKTSCDSKEQKSYDLLEEKVIIAVVDPGDDDPTVINAPKLITTSDNYRNELLNSPNIRAMTGPMSPLLADKICNKVTPKRSRGMRFTQSEKIRRVRLTDPEKGIENICRPVCLESGITLIERWNFLPTDGFLNLQSTEGFNQLENHLKRDENKENDDLNSTIDFLTELVGSMQISESRLYLIDDYPTKTDKDVFDAINTGSLDVPTIKIKLKNYPNLFLWYQRIEGYSEAERKRWISRPYVKPQSKSTGSTPISVRTSKPIELSHDNTRKKLIFDMDI